MLRKPNQVLKKKEKVNPDNSHPKIRRDRKRKHINEYTDEQKNLKAKRQAYEIKKPTEEAEKLEERNANKQAMSPAEGLCSSRRSRTTQDLFSYESSRDEANRKFLSGNDFSFAPEMNSTTECCDSSDSEGGIVLDDLSDDDFDSINDPLDFFW